MGNNGRRILRKNAVCDRVGLSASQIWRLEEMGRFPARVQITETTVGWFEDEVDAWVNARPRGPGRRLSAQSAATA